MDFFDNEYYRFTRYLMASVGLWPYQESKRRVVLLFCMVALLMVSQLAPFITNEYSASLFIEVFSFIIFSIAVIVKYNTVYLNFNHVRMLFDQIRNDWNLIQNVDELEIIRKYAYKTRYYTILSGLIVYPGSFVFVLTAFLSDIFDIIIPLDEPRPRQLPIQVECFFDQEKYFYLVFFLLAAITFLAMTIFLATESMYVLFLQHACGLLELTSYRITCAFDERSSKTASSKTERNIWAILLSALRTHQRCLEFIKDILQFSTAYFILCILAVASLSINLMRCFQSIAVSNIDQSVSNGLFVYSHICYIFWVNYFGQDLIDHSEHFFQQIYSAQWYTAPLHAQKLLIIVLQRSIKNSNFTIGYLLVISLESFSTLLSMSLSYCMVMYSVRN